MKKTLELYSQRNFAQIMNSAFWYVRVHFHTLVIALACSVAPLKLLQTVALKLYSKQASLATYRWLRDHPTSPFTEWTLFTQTLSPSFFVIIFFTLFINLTIAFIVFSHIIEYEEAPQKPITFVNLWERIEIDLFSGLGLWFTMAFLLLIASAFFLIPGIYLAVPFLIALLIHMREGASIPDTLQRSIALYKGQWWTGFGLVVVFILMQLAFAFGLGLLVTLLYRFLPPVIVSSFKSVLNALVTVVDAIATAVMYVAMALQYYSLLEKKEGIGLLNRVEAIGQISTSEQFSVDNE
ncbi:hypothetical protein GCM10027341_38160 [Spirosoma knui]